MKATISIDFKEILGKEVNAELIRKNPALPSSTENTLVILCRQIEKYFKKHSIKTKAKFQLENGK